MSTEIIEDEVIPYAPFEEALEKYKLPFELHDYQMRAINYLCVGFDRVGLFAEVGCGKTVMATMLGLAWDTQQDYTFVVVVPPILIKSWYRWLTSLQGIGSVLEYLGTPAKRRSLDVAEQKWIIMSMQVFKNDREHLKKQLGRFHLCGIVDEATAIKNTGSDNYKYTRDFFEGHKLMLLTGTPLSNPGDAYAYTKLKTPLIYRSKGHFENIHVAERDFFGNVSKWRELELMQGNFLLNSVRILKEDVLKHLKQPIYTPIVYELDPKHKELYNQLAEEQLLELESGGKIDATSASRLYNCLQQIVVNWDHFTENLKHVSASLDIVDQVCDEVFGGVIDVSSCNTNKLIIFSNYRMTNRKLTQYLSKYGAVAAYSDVTPKQQSLNIDRFLGDPTCRVLIAQPLSAGMGLNLQGVCSDVLFLETPLVPKDFHQAVGRVYREGQTKTPNVRIAIAAGTIQERLHRQLLHKDSLVNKVQIGFQDLKEAIYGR